MMPTVAMPGPLHIGISGPIATESVAGFIKDDIATLPKGYSGAPLLGTLIGALLDRGHHVSAYTLSSNLPLDLPQPIMAQGERFKIYYCPMRKHSMRMNGWHLGRIVDFYGLERRYLAQAIQIDNPDIVHAHWAYEFALAAIASGKPHVVTCHDAPQEVLKYMSNLYRLGHFFMALKTMRAAQKLTTVSPYMRKALFPLTRKNIEVIPNSIPPMIAHRTLDPARQLSLTAPVVVMVANGWGRLKNPQAGLLAFAKLRVTHGGARLRLFGADFGQSEVAHRWAQAQGIAKGMEFVGKLRYENLLEEIAKGDVLLHPSLEESFGMVVAEAMALGLPVVGGKTSGAVPWVIGDGGALVDVSNPTEIADALKALLSNQDHWRKFREVAHQTSQARFSPEMVTAAYENVYRQQIEGSKSSN
ncbi:MAG: glycosyltransferase family 4 protein [Burkholderiaceae bacterium]